MGFRTGHYGVQKLVSTSTYVACNAGAWPSTPIDRVHEGSYSLENSQSAPCMTQISSRSHSSTVVEASV